MKFSDDDNVEGSEEKEIRTFNTGNYCFICLSFVTPRHDKAIAGDWDNPNSSSSLSALLRYLNLGDKDARPELGGGTHVVSSSSFISGGPDTTVLLCELCSKINYKVDGLVRTIQLAQMEMNHYLDIIHKKIKYSGRIPDDVKIGNCTKNRKLDVENMREEILNKCLQVSISSQPQVMLKRINLDQTLNNPRQPHPQVSPTMPILEPEISLDSNQIDQISASSSRSPPILVEVAVRVKNVTPTMKNLNVSKSTDNAEYSERAHCRLCKKSFCDAYALKKHHIVLHEGVRLTYKCEVCQKVLATRHRLERHRVEVHQNGKVYQCGSCDMKFPLRQKLYQHRNKVHLQISLRCKVPGCPSIYKYKRDLDHHLKTIHPDFKEDVTPVAPLENKGRRKDRGRKDLSCDICGKIVYNNYGLKCHKKKVHEADQLICKHCNRSFPIHSKAFSSHVKDCANKPKKFSCNICNLKFSGRTSLRSHKMTVHVRSQQYKCDQCNRIFYRSSYLTAHQRSVHTWSGIRFNCTVPGCEKTYKVKHALKAHLLTVHNTVMTPKNKKAPENGKNGERHLEQTATITKTQPFTNVKCEAPENPVESEDFPIVIGSVIPLPCKSEKDDVGGAVQETDRDRKQCEMKKEAATVIYRSAKLSKCGICLKKFRNKSALKSHCRHVHKSREK